MSLNHLVPQTRRIAQTMIHGSNDAQTWPVDGCNAGAAPRAGMVAAEWSRWRQTLRKPMRQAIDTSEAPISTIHGLMKFEIRNCGTAKETPQTRMAGQICTMPRQPAKAQISQNGTISEKNGSCRPTMAPSR